MVQLLVTFLESNVRRNRKLPVLGQAHQTVSSFYVRATAFDIRMALLFRHMFSTVRQVLETIGERDEHRRDYYYYVCFYPRRLPTNHLSFKF